MCPLFFMYYVPSNKYRAQYAVLSVLKLNLNNLLLLVSNPCIKHSFYTKCINKHLWIRSRQFTRTFALRILCLPGVGVSMCQDSPFRLFLFTLYLFSRIIFRIETSSPFQKSWIFNYIICCKNISEATPALFAENHIFSRIWIVLHQLNIWNNAMKYTPQKIYLAEWRVS